MSNPQNPYDASNPYAQPSSSSSATPYGQPSYDQSGYDQSGYGSSGYDASGAYGQPSAGGYAGYNAPQPYAQQYQTNPYSAVMAADHPQGTTILVLGILGFFTWITGLIAWVMGAKAEKEMTASGVTYANASNIKIGKILGMVTTILGALGILAMIAYFIVIFVMIASFSTY